MDLEKRDYYTKMMKCGRLLPLFNDNNRIIAFITYYIGTGDMSRYINRDPWTIVVDEPWGDKIYIDQMFTDKEEGNQAYSWQAWRSLLKYIKEKYPKVEEILWHRYKGGKIHVYNKSIRRQRVQSVTV